MATVTKKDRKNIQTQKIDSVSALQIYSYKLLNDRVQFLYPKLTGLEKTLKQAMIPVHLMFMYVVWYFSVCWLQFLVQLQA